MPNQTENLGFNTWLENEVMDVEQLNANFNKLDGYVFITESGTKPGTCSPNSNDGASVVWHYDKRSDGVVEMDARVSYNDLLCNSGASPYYSSEVQVYFPFTFKKVYRAQILQSANALGWTCETTGATLTDHVTFKSVSIVNEGNSSTTSLYKEFFISVKGELV